MDQDLKMEGGKEAKDMTDIGKDADGREGGRVRKRDRGGSWESPTLSD
jgi:hypothetical protein